MTFGKPLGLTSLIGKKMVKIQQQKTIAIAKSSYSANNVPKMRNCNKLYIFENPLTQWINVYPRKTENMQIPFKD